MTRKKDEIRTLGTGAVARKFGVSPSTIHYHRNKLPEEIWNLCFKRTMGGQIEWYERGIKEVAALIEKDRQRKKNPIRSTAAFQDLMRRMRSNTKRRISFDSQQMLFSYVNKLLSGMEALHNILPRGEEGWTNGVRAIADDLIKGLQELRTYIADCQLTPEELVKDFIKKKDPKDLKGIEKVPDDLIRNILGLGEGQAMDQGEIVEPGPDLETGAVGKARKGGGRRGKGE